MSSQMCSFFLSKRLGLLQSRRHPMKHLHFLQNLTPFAIRCFSRSNQHSFTVSYLINSCGLSPETAISASKKVRFKNPENPDSVLALLRSHGFTDTHISQIVAKLPPVLLANPEKTLLPKLQFLVSAGLSHEDVAKVLVTNPIILHRSLENNLIPTYTLIKDLGISDENAAKALMRQSWSSCGRLENSLVPNARLLLDIGVPLENLSFLVTNYPTLGKKSEDFSNIVKKVMEMGFDPEKLLFVNAVQVLCQMSERTLEDKMRAYRSCGLSDDEIMLAFRKHPICLQLSEKKIVSTVGYLVKMGWEPAYIARVPVVIFLGLEGRIVPRCSVMKLLSLKGLEKKGVNLGTFLKLTEKSFIERFIIKHEKEVPHLLDAYHAKLGFQELLGYVSKER